MRRTIWLTVILLIGLASGAWPSQPRADEQTDTRRTALQPVSFRPLPLGQVKPSGWLREQLETQAAGLSGHLDEFWPDIKNSAWIGGNAEGWERVPYWLDGIVPLAYLLDDQALQARIKPFIDSILDHQQPDGWLGPVGDTAGHQPHDVWPLFPLFKALTQYQEATGDPRVVPALLRCAREIDQVIDQKPLYSWAKMRAADFALSMVWLYARTGETWPLELARKAFTQTIDQRPMGASPFTSEVAPVIARVKGRRLADWKIAKGAAAPPPSSPVKSAAPLEELILIPYGCTDLRITEFPTLAPR